LLPWLSWLDFAVLVCAIIGTPLIGCIGSSFRFKNVVLSYLLGGAFLIVFGGLFAFIDSNSSGMDWFVLGWTLCGVGIVVAVVKSLFAGLFTAD